MKASAKRESYAPDHRNVCHQCYHSKPARREELECKVSGASEDEDEFEDD